MYSVTPFAVRGMHCGTKLLEKRVEKVVQYMFDVNKEGRNEVRTRVLEYLLDVHEPNDQAERKTPPWGVHFLPQSILRSHVYGERYSIRM